MGLRAMAERDLGMILEDSATGFGWPIVITSPEGFTASMTGFSTDISDAIDPETGLLVSGRRASVAIRNSTLSAVDLAIPSGIWDAAKRPWVIEFTDIGGTSKRFKVAKSNPDYALGVTTLELEGYK